MQTTLFATRDEPRRFFGDERKLRGGYYTPADVADLLARWGVRDDNAAVLEPSCGDGEIVEAAARRLSDAGKIVGVELFPAAAEAARHRGLGRAVIHDGDFFSWFLDEMPIAAFDAVLGNPPFLRFHTFPEAHRNAAFALMRQEGLSPNRLTNAWVPFVVAATAALATGGRLAMVLPAELLQVSYAAELRAYLSRKYRRLVIATFRTLLFSGAEQETVLLFGIREDGSGARMKWIELDGLADLPDIERVAAQNGNPVDLDHAREKWTQYYLSPEELGLVRALESSPAIVRLGELASVDVGIVTGRNEFFVLSPSTAKEHGLSRWCEPIVGRSAQIPGITFTADEFERLKEDDSRCLLLRMPQQPKEKLAPAAREYVLAGERADIHQGYKCRIRMPIWWTVPSVWIPDAFLLRQIHDGPRIVRNAAGVANTDTIHRLRVKAGISPSQLAAVSVNSLTFAFSEILGRSYGGGVLELEPSEAERLPMPKPPWNVDARAIDAAVRSREVERALDITDDALHAAGVGPAQTEMLRSIWRRLYSRRLQRRSVRPRAAAANDGDEPD